MYVFFYSIYIYLFTCIYIYLLFYLYAIPLVFYQYPSSVHLLSHHPFILSPFILSLIVLSPRHLVLHLCCQPSSFSHHHLFILSPIISSWCFPASLHVVSLHFVSPCMVPIHLCSSNVFKKNVTVLKIIMENNFGNIFPNAWRSEGSRFTLGVWGQGCVRQKLSLCPQAFATVRNRLRVRRKALHIGECIWSGFESVSG